MKKQKCYIAGPMRGYPKFNFPAFMKAEADLSKDYEVFNPARKDVEAGFNPEKDQAKDLHHYMRKDIQLVCQSDVVFVLKGWENSEGACNEVSVARMCNIPVLTYPEMEPATETVLQEAARLVDGPRSRDYGHPRENFRLIADLWMAYLGATSPIIGPAITPRDVGIMMMLLKISRDANKPKRDNIVDIAGFCRCIERTEEQ